MSDLVLEAFAGPGGWSEGLRQAGFTGRSYGFEWDGAACRTATAAGHARVRADVARVHLDHLAGLVDGAILSPPCQAWSNAGDQLGKLDQGRVYERIAAFARGEQPPVREWADERSKLTAEPMRWAYALRPRWIALEQVPPVLPLWQYTAEKLRELGYRVWFGILSAEQYGVPQTRRRAILIARRDGLPVGPPPPTHQQYRAGRALLEEPDLFGDPLPAPVSMAQALGWGIDSRPAWTVTGGGTESGGGVEVFAYAGAREAIAQARNSGPGAERDPRPVDAPSYTIRANGSGSHPSGTEWVMRSNYGTNGNAQDRGHRGMHEPAPTMTPKTGQWMRQTDRQANGGTRSVDDPSLTITASLDNGNMRWAGEARMFPAGLTGSYDYSRSVEEPSPTIKGGGSGGQYVSDGEETVRVTVQEAAVLQSFPADYPWQGNKSQQYRCVGDAVPPLLAKAILQPLLATPVDWRLSA